MYSLSIPVAQLRTKMRSEFERHRYVNQIGVVDMLLFQSHAEFQVRGAFPNVTPILYVHKERFRASEDGDIKLIGKPSVSYDANVCWE